MGETVVWSQQMIYGKQILQSGKVAINTFIKSIDFFCVLRKHDLKRQNYQSAKNQYALSVFYHNWMWAIVCGFSPQISQMIAVLIGCRCSLYAMSVHKTVVVCIVVCQLPVNMSMSVYVAGAVLNSISKWVCLIQTQLKLEEAAFVLVYVATLIGCTKVPTYL